MTRVIRAGLIQASLGDDVPTELESLKTHLIEKHLALIDDAANQGVEVLCLQELFYGPYFCAEQDRRWYAMAEKIPEGPTVRLMQDVSKKHGMTLVVPIYEESMAGVYYNTAAVLDSDGSYRTSTYNYSDTAYSASIKDHDGFVKGLADPETEKILGCHIIGTGTATLIQEMANAMRSRVGVDAIVQSNYGHPALPEVVQRAFAGLPV